MPKRMPFGKFITSFLTLCSGLTFGKEGPLVTISSAWAHLVTHYLDLNRTITKTMVTSGAAAGLAAAFNTPIAAVVFTIEEILGELNTKYLGPIIMTSVIASLTSYKLLGNKPTFSPMHYGFEIEWHLILYFFLGLGMSIVGILLVKAIIFFKSFKSRFFGRGEYFYIVFAVVLVGIFSLITQDVLGDGTKTINSLLLGQGERTLGFVAILFLTKFLLLAISYSTGLSGGLFMPVLFLGSVGGSLFAILLNKIGLFEVPVGAFALLGMTSLLVAVIRTPFTAFIMLFEMTRDYEFILPLMVSSITAYWVSSILNPESVYESVAEYEGVHLPSQRDNECLNELTVERAMKKNVMVLYWKDSLSEIMEKIQECPYGGFPVIKQNKLYGVVNRGELRAAFRHNPEQKIGEFAKESLISIYPDQSLLIALDRMKRFEIGRLPVVSRFNDKRLIGLITPEDIVTHLGLTKAEPSREE